MRDAGFTGHSRGLKTMRDETTLINRMVASIQESSGSKQAGTLYHVVFGKRTARPALTGLADILHVKEPSNYQLIRTINRLGNDKKSSILEYMCENIQLESLSSYPTSTTCVQSIIQQYLPNLSQVTTQSHVDLHVLINDGTGPRRLARQLDIYPSKRLAS